MPRIRPNFIREQTDLWRQNKHMNPQTFVKNFREHYKNLGSFASSISRFKSELRRKHGAPEDFLVELKPTAEETALVKAKNKQQLELKCRESVTLRNCGDNMIMYFRSCLDSNQLGELCMGIQATTGFRMLEMVCRAFLQPPKLNHKTDDIYWALVKGICKKKSHFTSHHRPLLHRREIIQAALDRLRNHHFPHLQNTPDNTDVSRKCCKKINRAIARAWPFPEIKRVTSHFFRSFYVSSTYHYFNEKSSISAWAADVLAHESLDTSHPYTGLLITGFGSLSFDTERQLQSMARLKI